MQEIKDEKYVKENSQRRAAIRTVIRYTTDINYCIYQYLSDADTNAKCNNYFYIFNHSNNSNGLELITTNKS